MAGTTATKTAAKRAPRVRKTAAPAARAPQERDVPDELKNFYDQVDAIEADTEDVSLDMVSKTDAERAKTVPREKLFSIDGVEHTIPVSFGPNLALTFIDLVSRPDVGEDVALGRVLRVAMGESSWRALCEFPDLEAPHLKKILGITFRKVMGAVEAEKGK